MLPMVVADMTLYTVRIISVDFVALWQSGPVQSVYLAI